MQHSNHQFLELPYSHAAWFALRGFATLMAALTRITLSFRVGRGSLR